MAEEEQYFSRDEILVGMPARQATLLVFAIENRTAQLVQREREALSLYRTPKSAEEIEQAFLKALAEGREVPFKVSIQDIEKFAPLWAPLVPESPGVRAVAGQQLIQKYGFTYEDAPRLREALGLDLQEVQNAYQRIYGKPVESVFLPRAAVHERLLWMWSSVAKKLDSLPNFWVTFFLTLPGAVGLLALPIALANIGFVNGLLVLVLFAVLNMLTIACLAEGEARSGISHFGLGFLGQLVDEYLGSASSTLISVVMILNNFFVLVIFFIGVGSTLADATRLPAILWIAALFGVCMYFLVRRSINATVASSIMVVLASLVIIIVIPLMALPYFKVSNLASATASGGGSGFNPAAWGFVLGIMLSTFFSHILVAAYAPVGLSRDPGGKSWIWGSITAIFVLFLIACLWMVTINGVVTSEDLANAAGTVLTPLAGVVGQGVLWLGSLLVILSLGLASIQIALVLYYITDERIPAGRTGTFWNKLGERGRWWLAISPVIAVFLLAEWVTIAQIGSYTALLSIIGALTLPLIGGIFPVLILAATRRKGDYVPDAAPRLSGNVVVQVLIFMFYVGSIFLYGLVIWEQPLQRLLAVATGVAVLVVTMITLRRGALVPRTVVELRQDQRLDKKDFYQVTDGGKRGSASASLSYADHQVQQQGGWAEIAGMSGLLTIKFWFEAGKSRWMKIWVHRITPEGRSERLQVRILVSSQSGDKEVPAGELKKMEAIPVPSEPHAVTIELMPETNSGKGPAGDDAGR